MLVILIAADAPNAAEEMPPLAVENSLLGWVRSVLQLLPAGQYVYIRRGFVPEVLPEPVKVAVRFSLRNCCAAPPFSTTSPSGES